MVLVLVVSILLQLARQRRQDLVPNVVAARRFENAAELIVVALVWLLAICTVLAGIYNGLFSRLLEIGGIDMVYLLYF